jgi:murein DD-endopeptidase MepM/ murein hydrolase activator NlpD
VARRHRNRVIVALGALALFNGWMFLWRPEGTLTDLGALPTAAIGLPSGATLAAHASPPETACGPDPTRIFAGLEGLLRFDTQLGAGRTLRLALLELGAVAPDIDRLEGAVRTRMDLGLLNRTGAPVRVALDREGGLHAVELELAPGRLLQACRDEGGYRVRSLEHPVRTEVGVVAVTLGSDGDLDAALREAGELPELGALVADALAYDLDLATESRPGDRLQLMVERRWLGAGFHGYGNLLAVRWIGSSARVAYYRWRPDAGDTAWFDREGAPARRTLRRSPVAHFLASADTRASQAPRVEVVEGVPGAIYRLPEGAPLQALGDGTVRTVDESGERGIWLELEFADGTWARLSHLSRVVGELRPGAVVRAGQIIALAGHSGRTPTDRVRLELWRSEGQRQVILDPMVLTASGDARPPRKGDPIPEAQLERYGRDLAEWTKALRQGA